MLLRKNIFLGACVALGLTLSTPAWAQSFESKMADAADAMLAALGPKSEAAAFAFADPVRLDWHYTPRTRQGVAIRDMNETQRDALRNLMRTALSSPGILKARAIMALEATLAEIENSSLSYRDPEGYLVAVFGTPGTYPWGWRLEGHHLSINVTLAAPGEVSVTPAFLGTNPARIPSGPKTGHRIQYDEFILALRLARGLNDGQMAKAQLSGSPGNVVAGPGRGDAFKDPVGLRADGLSEAQRGLLMQLIAAYVGIARDEIGRPYMILAQETLDQTYFAWAGEISDRGAFYYRIHGPRLLIEFDNTRGGGNHIHSVWRDPAQDFGRDALWEHYQNAPEAHRHFP